MDKSDDFTLKTKDEGSLLRQLLVCCFHFFRFVAAPRATAEIEAGSFSSKSACDGMMTGSPPENVKEEGTSWRMQTDWQSADSDLHVLMSWSSAFICLMLWSSRTFNTIK